jgi:hypothetical protein
MDPLYATWPIGKNSPTLGWPQRRLVGSMDAFSFGRPARGLHAFRQEWAPALDLFDIDRPDDAPQAAPLALVKLVVLVAGLTMFAGLLLGIVGRVVIEAFSGT